MKSLSKLTLINHWRYYQLTRTISRLPLFIEQYKYDLIWQNRLIIHHQSFFERKLSKPFVFDFDDAVWLNDKESSLIHALKKAAMVFAGNEYLAAYAIKHNRNTLIIPTVIDPEFLYPINTIKEDFIIGWIGTESNFKYLEIAKPAIEEFLKENNNAKLVIVSSTPPPQFKFDGKKYVFEKWSAEKENELINKFSIGIMPLPDDAFTQGKCSYKMIQYMACAIPVVVSPVGTNNKILNEMEIGLPAASTSEWLSAFNLLKNEKAFYESCAANARVLAELKYSVNVLAPVIAENFRKII
ncbi:MAG TPA: glycosyltransferase [Chitinophagaceae bacterium]|nr:glycosyltransferase [Chitinophagaceae bacterium]